MEQRKMSGIMNLISSLAGSAMYNLGKIINPMTNKTEVNLSGAQAIIDMLDSLEEKTKGNLTEHEDKFLKASLADLKLNYFEVLNEAKDELSKVNPASEVNPDGKRPEENQLGK